MQKWAYYGSFDPDATVYDIQIFCSRFAAPPRSSGRCGMPVLRVDLGLGRASKETVKRDRWLRARSAGNRPPD
jgi:hypothetical protein